MRMAEHSELHAFVGHENPTILLHAERSGGGHAVGDVRDPAAVAAFAREREIDLAMVSADEPLAAGVVDALHAQGTARGRPDARGRGDRVEQGLRARAAGRGRARGGPAAARRAQPPRELDEAFAVVRLDARRGQARRPDRRQGREGDGPAPRRPRRGACLRARAARRRAAPVRRCWSRSGSTAPSSRSRRSATARPSCSRTRPTTTPTASTATRVRARAAWARCRCPTPTLPFMTAAHYEQACTIIEPVIERLRALEGRHFSGVMNSGFFATAGVSR